jgi:hypothetical protein
MSDIVHTGGCMCGAVRFSAAGEPLRVGLCHCEICRRNTGSAFGSFAVFERGRVTFGNGDTGSYRSSPGSRRHFCRDCGSPVYSTWDNEDIVDIYVGALDDPARMTPTYELWIEGRQPWLPKVPGLASHAGDGPDWNPEK